MKKIDLTQGKVMSVIIALALPIMGSSLLQFTYNLIDMIWVGGLGSNAVASIGSSSFFIGLGYSINSLVVIGAGIKIAHGIGEKNEIQVKKYVNSALLLNLIIGLVYGVVLILFGDNFIGFLKIGNLEVEKQAFYYLAVNAPILFFTFYNTLFTRILGSYGNNKEALKISVIGVIINIILDPLFIYTFKMGVIGAAVATLIANMVMFIIYLIKGKNIFKYDFKVGVSKEVTFEIVKLGMPMATQRILFTIINILLAKLIAIFGADAIAAQKVGLQIESVVFMVIGGLNGAVAGFTGQNYGAKKIDRVKKGYYSSIKLGMVYSIIMTLIFLFFSKPLINLFVTEPNVVSISTAYLRAIAFSTIFSTIEMISNGFFTGIGKPKIPANISIIFTVLRLPMAVLFINYFGVNGIWISIALSSVMKGVAAYLFYIVTIRKEELYATGN